jgi:hypothetical protein
VKLLLITEDLEHKVSPSEITKMSNEYTYGDLVQGFVRYEDQIEKHLDLARAAAKDLTGKVGASQLLASAVYYAESGTEWLAGVATGANLSTDDPRLALRRFRGLGRVQTPIAAFVSLKSIRAFHYGRGLSVIKYRWDEKMDLTVPPEGSKPIGKNGKGASDA